MEPTQTNRQPITVDKYHPQFQAKVKSTMVTTAKYPAIDAHNHFRGDADVELVVAHMDACNVRVFTDLSGGRGDHLKRRLEYLKDRYPQRFAVFYVPNLQECETTGFAERTVCDLEEAVRMGVQGVKVYKELGLTLRDRNGVLLHVNDPRLAPIWQAAGELGLPVTMHVADPWAYFAPLDNTNERYVQLYRDPSRHFYGRDYPTLNQLLDERDEVVESYPRTTFIAAHVGSQAENLEAVAAVLDRYPNYYIDFSARVAELGRKPRLSQAFFLRYQNRIVFGTDGLDDPVMYQSYFRFLETDDECMEYYMYPLHGFFSIAGLNLPDNVLRKVYFENAVKLIPHLVM